MEDDHVPLISNHRRRQSCCRNKYRPSCVCSKGAVFILILCFFAFTITTNFILSITLPVAISKDILNTWTPSVFGIFAVVCLSFQQKKSLCLTFLHNSSHCKLLNQISPYFLHVHSLHDVTNYSFYYTLSRKFCVVQLLLPSLLQATPAPCAGHT